MFFNDDYEELLKGICSLTRLYSESEIPYLNYRIAENIFCRAFNAKNLARKDSSFDAKKDIQGDSNGIGLKTFQMRSDNSLEKIAEFNEISGHLRKYSGKELAVKVAQARNERILTAINLYETDNNIYHCVGRQRRKLCVFEESYDLIELDNIGMITSNNANILKFKDGLNEYSYNISKSTLYKRFNLNKETREIDIRILEDPFNMLAELFEHQAEEPEAGETQYVVLPLYSTAYSDRRVAEKSGLNQWNAGGRERDYGEVYIPIPIKIHRLFEDFFPPRDQNFNLELPNGETLSAKVCQQNRKALMTNPNNALSDWLLRNVLGLEEGELATREKLDYLGFDSVRVEKKDENNFSIDMEGLGAYEEFIEENEQTD